MIKDSEILLRRLSPTNVVNRWLTSNSSPTSDLYFANACADLISKGDAKRYSPTVFASDKAQLVMRHDARCPTSLNRDNLVYFIDDRWDSLGLDPGLPRFYRYKMSWVEGRSAKWFMQRADAIVVSTDLLAEAAKSAAPETDVFQIDPYWSEPPADLSHFNQSRFDICYLGGQVHSTDLAFLLPVVREVLAVIPEATFTLSVGHRIPSDLVAHPRVHRLQALRWRDYRRVLTTKRFHIALYPLMDTLFNRGRSINKVMEHAVVGAVGIYSDWWAQYLPADIGAHVVAVPNETDEWVRAIVEKRQSPDLEKLRLDQKAIEARMSRSKDMQMRLWKKLLNI